MKKLLLVIGSALILLSSCKKDNVLPIKEVKVTLYTYNDGAYIQLRHDKSKLWDPNGFKGHIIDSYESGNATYNGDSIKYNSMHYNDTFGKLYMYQEFPQFPTPSKYLYVVYKNEILIDSGTRSVQGIYSYDVRNGDNILVKVKRTN